MNDHPDIIIFKRAVLDAIGDADRTMLSRINDLSKQLRTGLAGGKSKGELTGHDRFIRHASLRLWMGGHASRSVADAYAALYGPNAGERGQRQQRAAVAPAMTAVPSWASELVGRDVYDFLFAAATPNIFGQLGAWGVRIDATTGSISLPARMPGPPVGGFIGEGQPIGVYAMNLMSTLLVANKKAAAISTFSTELRAHSTPSIETLVAGQVGYDLGRIIDGQLLSDFPATGTAPRGLRNGVAPIPPSGAATADERCREDLKALAGAVVGAGGSRPLFIMNPLQAMSVSLLAGQFSLPVLQSGNVEPGMVLALDASNFASMLGTSEVDSSEQAALHMEDATPLPIIGGGGVLAVPTRSTWQTATIGVRVIVGDLDWTLTAPNMVSWMEAVQW